MKRTSKAVFFIVAVLIVAFACTAFFGIYTHYGDRRDTIIRGAGDIRWGIDIQGGIDVTFAPSGAATEVTVANMDAVAEVLAQRLVSNNITDYEMYTDYDNEQVVIRFPWQSSEENYDPQAAIQELGQTAQLTFRIGDASETMEDENGNPITVPTGKLVLSGKDVANAEAVYVNQDNNTSEPMVRLTLNESGKQAFAEATKQQHENGGTISIWLDNDMISNPTVEAAITDGIAVISGYESIVDAQKLANLINSGVLPFSLSVKSYGTIEPTLGLQALNIMLWAGIIAFVLIAILVIAKYRLPGVVAVIALIGQAAGIIACVSGYFSVFDSFTLTLPGIAGIILSIGIGVDANVVMAERIREEIRSGHTIDASVRRGGSKSFWAIFDGNITNVIVAVVLMGVFGPSSSLWSVILKPIMMWFPAATTGTVYSFGYTLIIGIIFNFIMGVGASHWMLKSISRFRWARNPWLYGGERK